MKKSKKAQVNAGIAFVAIIIMGTLSFFSVENQDINLINVSSEEHNNTNITSIIIDSQSNHESGSAIFIVESNP